ncbi:MAG: hypothetical protein PF572_02490 [Patescibacteria group bacterium]|jgi:hypothetical protein|nr:hypothetical protein [Patescibacteria group bacterium]
MPDSDAKSYPDSDRGYLNFQLKKYEFFLPTAKTKEAKESLEKKISELKNVLAG